MHSAAALSEHPLATHAVGECVGHLLETGGTEPDVVVVFVTTPQAGATEDVIRTTRQLLRPRTLVGTTAVSVLGGSREVEDHSAVAMFALWSDGPPPTPVRLQATPGPDGPGLQGLGPITDRLHGTLLLLADPFTFPADHVLDVLHERSPGLQVIGGLASAARQRGGNYVVLDGAVHRDGAAGVLLPPEVRVTPIVSQGCRPIGDPFTVTGSERNVIYELAGRPALDRLTEVVGSLDDQDRALAANGLHIGRVIDEHRAEFGRGDFLVRGVLGGDREARTIAVGDVIDVGATVQFQVRDAGSADEDLRLLMADRTASGALVFTCNGRGSALFGIPDHDAAVVSEALRGAPVAGMFCAGELGPVGGRNFVHGFTASMALFG